MIVPEGWSKLTDERGADGELTDLALALDALQDEGCDCGTDEQGSCLACKCELALITERTERDAALAEVERLRGNLDAATDAIGEQAALRDVAEAEVERLKKAINIDRTGLAHALSRVRNTARGYGWIPSGEWGCYSYEEQTEETIRREVGYAFDQIESLCMSALKASGDLATLAVQGRLPADIALTGDDGGNKADLTAALDALAAVMTCDDQGQGVEVIERAEAVLRKHGRA